LLPPLPAVLPPPPVALSPCRPRSLPCSQGRVGVGLALDLSFSPPGPPRLADIKSEKLSSACGSRATFLCVARETWPKERPPRFRAFRASGNRSCVASTPASMPSPARKVREPGPGFSTGHPALAKRSRHPCRLPLRSLSSPPRRCRGAPGRAAGHRGPHTSEELEQSKSRSAKPQLRTNAPSFFEDEAM